MAGRPSEVDHVLRAFLGEMKAANDLVTKVVSLKGGINPRGKNGLHPKYVRQVVELAFMGIVASWEEFVERVLVRYVAGAKTKSGYTPTAKFGLAKNIEHAYQIVSANADFDHSKHYLKVSDGKWITNVADFVFSSHGFSDVRVKSDLLKHASSIRNRVAHSSKKCREDFKATAIHFLAPANNKLAKGYGAGDLLMSNVARHFGTAVVQQGKTHFAAYTDLYTSLAKKIVP